MCSLRPVAVGALAALALAGCTGAGGDSASRTGDDPASEVEADAGGRWTASLGGEPIELDSADVMCETGEDSMHLRIGEINPSNPSRSTGIHAVVGTPQAEPEVRLVIYSLPDGTSLMHDPATNSGVGAVDAEAVVVGETYTVSGQGRLSGGGDSQRSTTQFELTVTCS